jgi:hypothetical protein
MMPHLCLQWGCTRRPQTQALRPDTLQVAPVCDAGSPSCPASLPHLAAGPPPLEAATSGPTEDDGPSDALMEVLRSNLRVRSLRQTAPAHLGGRQGLFEGFFGATPTLTHFLLPTPLRRSWTSCRLGSSKGWPAPCRPPCGHHRPEVCKHEAPHVFAYGARWLRQGWGLGRERTATPGHSYTGAQRTAAAVMGIRHRPFPSHPFQETALTPCLLAPWPAAST